MAETTTPHGQLILTVLGGLAELEHDLIRACTSEGRERAKARGGGKPTLMPHQQKEACKHLEPGETQRSVARRYIGLDGCRRVQAATSAVIFI